MTGLDFSGLAAHLAPHAAELCTVWLPGGKVRGKEYLCSDLTGGDGESLKFHIEKCIGTDFGPSGKGFGDLIALYAAVENLSMGDAAKQLAEQWQYDLRPVDPPPVAAAPVQPDPPGIPIPPDAPQPPISGAARIDTYRTADGTPLFHVARFDRKGEPRKANGKFKKDIFPFRWSVDGWISKAWPAPRPLLGLDLLAGRPQLPTMLVEGEPACEAARKIAGHIYNCVTWSGGSKADAKTDFSPANGRSTLLIPDADQDGRDVMARIAARLHPHHAVKIVDTADMPDGWDLADALADGWDFKKFRDWGQDRVSVWAPPAPPAPPPAPKVKPVQRKLAPAPPPPDDDDEPDELEDTSRTPVTVSGSLPTNHATMYDKVGLATTPSGLPCQSSGDLETILHRWPPFQGHIWYDEFHGQFFTDWDGPRRMFGDVQHAQLLGHLRRDWGLRKISSETLSTAMTSYCHRFPRNEPREWMEGLGWDRTPRLSAFFTAYLACREDAYPAGYVAAVSRNFWIGLVARVFQPGCKLDNMAMLISGEGTGKTTALEIIGGPWYRPSTGEAGGKDFMIGLQGCLLVEVAELHSFAGAARESVMAMLTRRVDPYRPPFGKVSVDHPRQCVFVGTTNDPRPCAGPGTNRRDWPLAVGRTAFQQLIDDREQLFAEAVVAFKAGETWHQVDSRSHAAAVDLHRNADAWEELLVAFLRSRISVDTTELAKEALGLSRDKLGWGEQRRVGNAMHRLGWVRVGNAGRWECPMPEENALDAGQKTEPPVAPGIESAVAESAVPAVTVQASPDPAPSPDPETPAPQTAAPASPPPAPRGDSYEGELTPAELDAERLANA